MQRTGRTWRRVLAAGVVFTALTATAGCAVSESDVHRWETTENGPEKLYAIVTHDKYSWALRDEAALSLVHMRPRSGKRIGLDYLALGVDTSLGHVQAALAALGDDARRHIVNDIAPKLVDMMMAPPPPKAAEGQPAQADPSIPYKDAAFAMLSHEPPLVGDDDTKAKLVAALTQWVQTDFDDRIDITAQQFGVEQIMRFVGPASVKALPGLVVEGGAKNDKACQLVADIGDDATKDRASTALVAIAKSIDSQAWKDRALALVNERNQKANLKVTKQQVDQNVKEYEEQELEKVFTDMKRVGGRAAIDYCLAFAKDKTKSEKMRSLALAALENRVDKKAPADVNVLFDIASDDANPDVVRGVALQRIGELPKEMIVTRLYGLFDKKWQVRESAAALVLKVIGLKEVPDFLRHLPADSKTKIGMQEPLSYGARIMAMDAAGGPSPRAVLKGYLQSPLLGAKLTAAGSYYQAKKADAAPVLAIDGDRTPLSKCDDADKCGWECVVGKDVKKPETVGEFVKWCVEPALQ